MTAIERFCENGFLLVANLDKAFDRGFISFKNNGTIKISEKLKKSSQINITLNLKLRYLSEDNKKYLKYYRDKILKNQNVVLRKSYCLSSSAKRAV